MIPDSAREQSSARACRKLGAEAELLDWCKDEIAGYKRPRAVSFMQDADVPRTATGKIQHRVLRERFARSGGG